MFAAPERPRPPNSLVQCNNATRRRVAMRGCANRHPLGYTRPGLTGPVAYALMAATKWLFTVRKRR